MVLRGFDLDLVNKVCAAVSVPVICSGGVGVPEHFIQVFNNTCSWCCICCELFPFYRALCFNNQSASVPSGGDRMEDRVQYGNAQFDGFGRF